LNTLALWSHFKPTSGVSCKFNLSSKYFSTKLSIFSAVISSDWSKGAVSPVTRSSITRAGNRSGTKFNTLAKKPYFVASMVAKFNFPLNFSAVFLRRATRAERSSSVRTKMCARGVPFYVEFSNLWREYNFRRWETTSV